MHIESCVLGTPAVFNWTCLWRCNLEKDHLKNKMMHHNDILFLPSALKDKFPNMETGPQDRSSLPSVFWFAEQTETVHIDNAAVALHFCFIQHLVIIIYLLLIGHYASFRLLNDVYLR